MDQDIHVPEFPCLITIHDYVRPARTAAVVVEGVRAKAVAGESDVLNIQGHFLLAFSTFEAMLSATLSAHLFEHPGRLSEEITVRRELVTETYTVRALLQDAVERRVRQLSFEGADRFFERFCSFLSIPPFVSSDRLREFERLKEERNLVVHRGLDADGSYLNRSLTSLDAPFGKRSVTNARLLEVSSWLLEMISALENALLARFGHLTRISVLREVWHFMLGSNVLVNFDDIWKVDEIEDSIAAFIGKGDIENRLSHSERILFQAWRAQFSPVGVELCMRTLSLTTAQKLFWFLEASQRMWVH